MLGKNSSSNIENSALAVGTNGGRTTPKRSDEKPHVWCDHCNKPRHTRDTCWKIHGKPTNWKGSHDGRFHRSPTAHEAEI